MPLASRGLDGGAATPADTTREAAARGVAAPAVLFGSRPRWGPSQMRPDEPCRRNDTDDRCSFDIDPRSSVLFSLFLFLCVYYLSLKWRSKVWWMVLIEVGYMGGGVYGVSHT